MLVTFVLWVISFFPQLDCMTEAIYYEAGNQSFKGKVAVGNVIVNRVDHEYWPSTACKVIKEPAQFSYYWDGKPDTLPKKDNRLENWALFESMIAGVFVLTAAPDITDNSVFYHSTKVSPSWSKRLDLKVQVGDHIMYALGE